MPTGKQLGLKDFPKVRDAVALQQISERGALPMIDREDYPLQSTVAAISGASLLGAGYGQFRYARPTA